MLISIIQLLNCCIYGSATSATSFSVAAANTFIRRKLKILSSEAVPQNEQIGFLHASHLERRTIYVFVLATVEEKSNCIID